MKIWIKALLKDRFPLQVSSDDKILHIKQKAKDHLSKLGVYVPSSQKLIHKGSILNESVCVGDIDILEEDNCLFLYDLKQKPEDEPRPTPPKVIASEPTESSDLSPELQNMIGSIVSSFAQSRQPQPPPPVATPPQPQPQPQPPPPSPQPPQPDILQFIQLENLPLPEPETLQTLVSMGFPEFRAKKALFLNQFDASMALDWLLNHNTDPTADDPLTLQEARQILQYLQEDPPTPPTEVHAPRPPPEVPMAQRLKEAIQNKKCTFSVTGKTYATQNWYHCYTCGLVDSEGICESCAAVCHKGHKLSNTRHSESFYCDCGAGAHKCECLE